MSKIIKLTRNVLRASADSKKKVKRNREAIMSKEITKDEIINAIKQNENVKLIKR